MKSQLTPAKQAARLLILFTPNDYCKTETFEEWAQKEGKEMALQCVDELLRYNATSPATIERQLVDRGIDTWYWEEVKKIIIAL